MSPRMFAIIIVAAMVQVPLFFVVSSIYWAFETHAAWIEKIWLRIYLVWPLPSVGIAWLAHRIFPEYPLGNWIMVILMPALICSMFLYIATED